MNHSTPPPDDSWESDAVWNLLDKAEPLKAGDSFVDDLVRMARQELAPEPWWKRLFAPAPIGGFAVAAAAVAIGILFLSQPSSGPVPGDSPLATVETPVQADPYDDLQDLAETEALLAAADHLDAFSDQELGDLIGF
ncbi:hypothetical protein OVA24_21305 [Luteolibacter sp. SL250]|uniref:hypothetical protein n=1 Tax=Luteolibacter sp. SL250 TaxID=2995170 RepID=UPI00226EF7EF|nr:hypothetical protein [Luteolibacter sp. SL250]WAC19757.1 hypothetical protein OVA24_21305 [Luteolibacter sp. SL250]